MAGCRESGKDSNADFLGRERFASLARYVRARRDQGSIPMTFVSRLSVVTAYVAFAFVGAIVLGMF
jgi:hypothetical protein